jgi:hypothetical protein
MMLAKPSKTNMLSSWDASGRFGGVETFSLPWPNDEFSLFYLSFFKKEREKEEKCLCCRGFGQDASRAISVPKRPSSVPSVPPAAQPANPKETADEHYK